MSADVGSPGEGPVIETDRITSLDLIRGVAVLGILLMNAVSFKHGFVPYFNLSAGGSVTWLDWAIGIFGEVFIDQKFMGLFSLLFGAGIMLFIERAEIRGSHPVLLNVWRNVLLLGIGFLHTLMWDGDVLMVYAVSAFLLVTFRKLSSRSLVAAGAAIFLLSAATVVALQYVANTTDAPLVGIWESAEATSQSGSPSVATSLMEALFLAEFFLRGLGLILMGAGLYRLGFMSGSMPLKIYKLIAVIGPAVGLPLAAAGVVITALGHYSREVAFIGQMPNTLGTIPATLGYLSLIVLWDKRPANWLTRRLITVGQMALTNYLSQSVLGVLLLTVLLADVAVNRAGTLVFCLAVWGLQLSWSQAWLSRFRFGPAEWLWRVATYRRGQRLRRSPATLSR